MERHARTRRRSYEDEGFVVRVVEDDRAPLLQPTARVRPKPHDDGFFPPM